ncbi:MAG: hypothetical protein DUW69_002241 [Verrucomicrobia bacterium]|nr:MAG: hypothetical protein DUW69_002241 [Verrucomicrobiota bacterium]
MKKPHSLRIAIISSSFRPEVADALVRHCLGTLQRHGVGRKHVDLFRVPGSMEIPLVAKMVAKRERHDAIITFGAIVKGKTYHFEQIANECARGCMNVSWEYEIPVIFEVLAVYDLADAVDRATRKIENKGVEAALTALEMIKVLSRL